MLKLNWGRKVTINFLLSYYRLIMPFLNWNKKLELNRKKIFDKDLYSSLRINEMHQSLNNGVELNPNDWNNLLIQGDNKQVMEALLNKFKGKISLIYIDPPFFTGEDYHFKTFIGKKDKLTAKAYSDSWDGGLNAYLNFIYERLFLIRELLSEKGSVYLHLDWHVSHYIKILLDEIFGENNFRNEIIWAYPAASVQTRMFYIRSYDTIFFYTKSDNYIFRDDPQIYMEYSDRVKSALKKDEKGVFYYRGGSHNGKKLSRKVYVKSNGIFPRDVWNDIPYIRANTREYQGFSTQKPERLLKRIILASSNENDIVADFFCGTGTALAVAEKLGRRWIGCDITPQSIHICRKRILDIKYSNDLLNWLKKYEKEFNSFKLLTLNNLENQFHIPGELLDLSNDADSFLSIQNEPKFDVLIKIKDLTVQISLLSYELPYLNCLNVKLRNKISHFSDWVDYWAVDFNYQGDFMKCEWVSFRNPKKRELKLKSKSYNYKKPGKHTIKIKVINIFGHEADKDYNIKL